MQLDSTSEESAPLRDKLARAALALILLELPAAAHADNSGPSTQMDVTSLIYNEQNRANVFEPVVRVTRLFPDGQSLSAQFGLDVITGASPTGELPKGIRLLPAAPICCTNT